MRFKVMLLAFVTILFNQNCSKIAVSEAGASFSAKDSDLSIDPNDFIEPVGTIEPDDAIEPDDMIDPDDLPQAEVPNTNSGDALGCVRNLTLVNGEFDFSAATMDRSIADVSGNIGIPLSRTLSMTGVFGNIQVEGAQTINLGENILGNLHFIAQSAPFMKEIRGNVCGYVKDVGEMQFIRGNIRITNPTASEGTIGSIADVQGNIIIRNYNVRSISNVKGNIMIYNGSVESLKDVQGNVILINSTVGAYGNIANLVH